MSIGVKVDIELHRAAIEFFTERLPRHKEFLQ